MQTIVPFLPSLLGTYLVIGVLFGIGFAFCGVKKIDPVAADAGIGFGLRLIE